MSDCEVCGGSKIIRVPIYRWKLDAPILDIADSLALNTSVRQYPCPECSDMAPFTRMAAIKICREGPDLWAGDPQFLHIISGGLARAIGDKMYEMGLIRFERSPVGSDGKFSVQASVGVIAPGEVAKFEERVAERQFEVAAAMAEEAAKQVDIWGSAYGQATITKTQAVDSIFSALKSMRKKYG